MKTKPAPENKKTKVEAENLHEIFMNSPSVKKLLEDSDRVLNKVKFPPNFFQKA